MRSRMHVFPASRFVAIPLLAIGASISACGLFGSNACAESPWVRFDTLPTAVCRDMPADESESASDPASASDPVASPQRRVEVVIRLSAMLMEGAESDLQRFDYHFNFGGAVIDDFSPRTTLVSDRSEVSFETKEEKTKSLGISAGGLFNDLVKVSGDAGIGSKNTSAVKYQQKPELTRLIASGTMNRGTAAYFKLRPFSQESLEGVREFRFVLRVPAQWQADYVQIRCQATGIRRGMLRALDEEGLSGRGMFAVALFHDSSDAGRLAAKQFAQAEGEFRRLAASAVARGNRQSRLLAGFSSRSTASVQAPAALDEAARNYAAVKQRLRDMNGRGETL